MTLVVICRRCEGKVNGPHGTLYDPCECEVPDL